MKKAIIAVLLGVIFLTTFAELNPNHAHAEYVYSCSMQILDMENQYLPTPSVPLSIFQKELKLQITNHTGQSDRYMILCVLNGEVLDFSTHDVSNVKQVFYDIGAYHELEIPLTIHMNKLMPGDNVLHITSIGLLDWIPQDNHDFFSYYSNTVSIPISSEGYTEEYANIAYYKHKQDIAPEIASSLKKITFIPDSGKIDDSIQTQYQSSMDGFTLESAIYNDVERICILFFVDNLLIKIDGRDSIILQAAPSSVYYVKQIIPMTEGAHQIYAIWLPLDLNQPAFASTTEKIVIQTKAKEGSE